MDRPSPGLTCAACGREYEPGPDEPWRCACGHALDFDVEPKPDESAPDPGALDRDRGLWAFDWYLPVDRRVTLGEGWTPVVEAPAWDATFKLEYLFPTGSFKDRGAGFESANVRFFACSLDDVSGSSFADIGCVGEFTGACNGEALIRVEPGFVEFF
jgi:threonine synthase